MNFICLESAEKNSFYALIVIQIPFFRVSVTIEPCPSLLSVCFPEMFDFGPYVRRVFSNVNRISVTPSFFLYFPLAAQFYMRGSFLWHSFLCLLALFGNILNDTKLKLKAK